ncbi:MAG: Maf family protein [Acidobacteriota bacterium]
MVILDGLGLGKPEDEAHARSMLRRLAGKTHTVMTGVALLDVDREELVSEIEVSQVSIDDIDGDVIDWYVATGEPLDKAGAYAIQGLGALFVQSVSGNYSNIVGLPLPLTQALFRRLGFDLRDFRSRQETNSE